MQAVRRATVVAQQQQAEPHLGDQECLGERDQVRYESARLLPPVVREACENRRAERCGEDEKCDSAVRR